MQHVSAALVVSPKQWLVPKQSMLLDQSECIMAAYESGSTIRELMCSVSPLKEMRMSSSRSMLMAYVQLGWHSVNQVDGIEVGKKIRHPMAEHTVHCATVVCTAAI